VGLAIAGLALIALVILAVRSPDDVSSKESADAEARRAAATAEPAPAPDPAPSVEPRSVPTPADVEQAAHARAVEEEKKLRSLPLRRAPLHTAPAQEPTREPKSEPRETPVPAPRPAPVPAPTDDFEKNPYLRR
jgi:hypothetical protein